MLSNAQIKNLRRYQQKKARDEDAVFVAEGSKLIMELKTKFRCRMELTSDDVDLSRITLLKTPRDRWALFEKPHRIDGSKQVATWSDLLEEGLSIVVDGVQDPGNLGTIIRVADWFGVPHVFCSAECADVFSPKTVQSTMGSLARVDVHEKVDLPALLEVAVARGIEVFGASLSGKNIYQTHLSERGVIVVGSEGNGISDEVMAHVTKAIKIPSYPSDRTTIDSLNVAMATAIICSVFRRG